jgi:hypothetical protein
MIGEFAMELASRSNPGRDSFLEISFIFSMSFVFVASSSMAMTSILSMPRVFGAVLAATAMNSAISFIAAFSNSFEFFIVVTSSR